MINSLGVGGAERMLGDLATGLDRERFRPEVLCLYDGGRFSAALESAGIPVRVLQLDRRFLPQNWVRTWSAVGLTDADVVHTHLPESNWYGLPAALGHRVPVRISHLHSLYLRWSPKTRLMDRVIRASASASVACAGAVADGARDLGYSDRKLRVIPNGVETGRFDVLASPLDARRRLGLPEEGPVLVSVGSLHEHKGHPHLFKAMTLVRRHFPTATLLIVGDANEHRRGVLRGAVEALDLREAVRFLGYRDDLPLLLSASDLFVMPSLREGFPMALLEAGAAGLPAVASAVGGIPEIVEDGVTGLLVPPQDEGKLGEALLRLLRSPASRQSMGAAARRRIDARFRLGSTVRQLEDLYLELLAGQRPTTAQ